MSRWIAIVIGLLVTNAIAVAVLVISSGDPSPRLVPDAYVRAIAFDETLAAMSASAELGWRAEATLAGTRAAPTGDRVEVVLTDGAGAPLAGAQVEVVVRHASRARGVTLVLIEHGPGRYAGSFDAQGAGLHAIEIKARRGDEHFAALRDVERREVAP